jgi:lantibiotic biosynthesis protein
VATGLSLITPGPLLQGALKEEALCAALHVAERLKDPTNAMRAAAAANAQSQFPAFTHWSPPSIGQGNAGLCLLWAYLDQCFPEQRWDITGKAHLEIAGRSAELSSGLGTGLFSGLSGLAFAGWQLSRDGTRYQRFLGSLDDTISREASALAAHVRHSAYVSMNDFDVISGLSGIGAYLLSRHEEAVTGTALGAVVGALISLVTRNEALPAWHTPADLLFDDTARNNYPLGNLNCGLAHGIPGVLAFLSLVRLTGLLFEDLDHAIATTASWLSTHRLDDEWGANWPSAIPLQSITVDGRVMLAEADLESSPGGPSRTAWCYGGPGVARALWLAGCALDRDDFKQLAVDAMEAVFRRPISVRMIDSPTFCHGVAGLLAITMRFANETGSPLFLDECQKLTEQILSKFQPDSLLGFRNLEHGGNQTDQPGLIEGASGVAAVLLSAATGIEPGWDRVFLLS